MRFPWSRPSHDEPPQAERPDPDMQRVLDSAMKDGEAFYERGDDDVLRHILSDEQIKRLEDELVNVPPYDGHMIPLVVRYTTALIEEVRWLRAERDDGQHPTDDADRYGHEHFHSHGKAGFKS